MANKTCSKCGIPKDSDADFSLKRGGRSPWCKGCHREYTKNHYEQNPAYYRKKARAKRRSLSALLNELKKGRPCTDCDGVFNPWQMDWDHLRDKKFNIAHGVYMGSKKQLLAEIAKCELVCANCHRQRTHERRMALNYAHVAKLVDAPDLGSGAP